MRGLLALLAASVFVSAAASQDRPLPPAAAAKAMSLPPGFAATLFAGEPDLVQPIAFTFDDRGRLWVVECLSYPQWTSDGTGHDRVVIFEDTDGDGHFGKKTVFFDKGVNLSGIEVGFGGVWLCSTPNLIFIPDRDGDDKPDGPPQVVLDGWDLTAKHNVFNSLTWGPDGWLYGCNGILSNSKVGKPGTPADKRVALNCGVWRYHPTRQIFETVASGTTNPWGLDFDEEGEMFITNCVIKHIWHVVPGAHFERMFGQDLEPNTYSLMPSIADHIHWGGGDWTTSRGGKGAHDAPGGGHAHSGCMIYLGDNWPSEYRGSAFMCNIHGNRINRDTLRPRGSTFVARHAPDFMMANDPWFRALALKYGPDGGVFVADWTDTGECHNYKVVDQTNGRIFKITHGTPTPWKGDLAKLSDMDLVKLQSHRNEWFGQHARRILQERAVAGRVDPKALAEIRATLEDDNQDPRLRLRALWLSHVTGQGAAPRLRDSSESVRRWSLRLMADSPNGVNAAVLHEALSNPAHLSESIKLTIAGLAQRVPPRDRGLLVSMLAATVDEYADPYLPLMTWYAIAPVVHADPKAWRPVLMSTHLPMIREYLPRRMVEVDLKNLDVLFGEMARWPVLDLLASDVFRGIEVALAGRRDMKVPENWPPVAAKLAASRTEEARGHGLHLGVLFGDEKAIDAVRKMAKNAAEPADKRRIALNMLRQKRVPELFALLSGMLDDSAVRSDAIRGLADFADPSIPELLLSRYSKLADAEKADVIQTLSARPAFAMALLDAVEKKTVPAKDITPFVARQIQALKDPKVSRRLEKVWGVVRPASADKSALTAKYRALLTPDVVKKADVDKGKLLFRKTCATCHKLYGEGQSIGPDLTGSQRTNLDYLLENVLDPSAVVAREYTVTVIELKNGRTLNGIIAEETPTALAVQTQNERLVISRGDIDTMTPTRTSLMPDGLFDALSNDEVRDLVGYLMKKK
jgi:putative membrane-bound dehydrogenase-like protein